MNFYRSILLLACFALGSHAMAAAPLDPPMTDADAVAVLAEKVAIDEQLHQLELEIDRVYREGDEARAQALREQFAVFARSSPDLPVSEAASQVFVKASEARREEFLATASINTIVYAVKYLKHRGYRPSAELDNTLLAMLEDGSSVIRRLPDDERQPLRPNPHDNPVELSLGKALFDHAVEALSPTARGVLIMDAMSDQRFVWSKKHVRHLLGHLYYLPKVDVPIDALAALADTDPATWANLLVEVAVFDEPEMLLERFDALPPLAR